MEETTTDVIETPASPSLDASSEAVSAPTDVNGEDASKGEQSLAEKSATEAEAPPLVPENDDDLKGQENNPHVQAVIRMRQEIRERDQRLDSYKPLESWKEIATAIPDPTLAKSAYELVQGIHTPEPNNPSGFTTRPFLEMLERDSAGAVDQLFADLLPFQYVGDDGKMTTLVRELYKSHGLNPDRVDEYRNIDTLRASGVVTAEDVSQIPEKYHDAFKSLSQPVREDLLSLKDTNPAAFEEYLRNANDALEARSWRDKEEAGKAQALEQQQQQFEQHVNQVVEQDIIDKSQAIIDSVHQSLSQITFSSDPKVNELEQFKILGVLGNLQSPFPAYRNMALKALDIMGIKPDGFEQLTTDLMTEREKFIRYKESGQENSWNARQALAAANLAEQRIMLKANDYAKRLAEANGQRVAATAGAQESALAAASARFVPSGNGQAQQGETNPYLQNPHPKNTPEYYAYYRNLDRELKIGGAAMLGGN